MKRGAHDAIGVHLELHRDRGPVLMRHEAAGVARQRMRQHRLDRAGDVDARPTPIGLTVEWPARPHVGGDIGDVYPQADPAVLAPGRDRVVEVGGRLRVDRQRRQRGEVDPVGADRRLARVLLDRLRKASPEPAVHHDRLHDVARDLGVAERADHARAALATAHEHHRTGARVARLLRRDRHLAAPLEQRRGGQEPALLDEHADDRPVDPAPPLVGRHSILSTSASTATGIASSCIVRGRSRAFSSGMIPVREMFSPLGR